jgi:DNA-binding MarR family transcriptional regulator
MSDPFSNHHGPVAVESDEGRTGAREASLVSVLEVGSRFYGLVIEALDGVGLTPPTYELLTHLRTDVAVALDELARLLRRSTSRTSRLVDELTERGLVGTEIEDVTGAAVHVTLTALGSERARKGRTSLDIVLSEFVARMALDDQQALDRLLSKVEW